MTAKSRPSSHPGEGKTKRATEDSLRQTQHLCSLSRENKDYRPVSRQVVKDRMQETKKVEKEHWFDMICCHTVGSPPAERYMRGQCNVV